MYLIYKAKKLKIVKLKSLNQTFSVFAIIRVKNDRPHACIYILCNSHWERFGNIRKNLFVQWLVVYLFYDNYTRST